ncbi:hypothetical protein SLS55_009750 [Diplodia seriata]|uniref:Heterokaryon incompatibility domain-containing protein n=1 Tax=Diplodia seriata TaxID=420778 RepID=A0ABR3C0X8_9PEZI
MYKAKDWIDTCVREHISCDRPSSQDLPTRLLNVSETELRLCTTVHLGEALYAALSYCWGGDQYQPNQLKGGHDGNLDLYTKGVPLSMFPRTLQDAITVTRDLGLNFIWIDSACIIQNDEEDKRREIAKMRRIYANSHVTIVASTARTAADGFLQDREPPPPPIKVPFPCAGGLLGSMYLRGRVSSGWTQYDVSSLHTDKRAWTMEEKLLSPRVLMYTDRQLRWVCDTTRDCDGGHIDSYHNDLVVGPSRVTYVGASVNPDRLDEYINASASPAGADGSERFAIAWSILVTCYTRRTVTHVRDRLRAIGGIAEEFSRLTGYRYLAGLWRETLAYDLLWKEDNPVDVPAPKWSRWRGEAPEVFLKKAQHATAPTWSWARGHYQITTWMHGRIDFSDFSIVDCNVELQSAERPYGDVLSGSLTLRGRMKQLYLLDSHKVQYLGRSIWKTGEDTYYTIGTANLDPFRPRPARDPHASGEGSRQQVLLFNFGTYNDDHENVGLVLSPLAGSVSTAAGRTSHTRMGIYTLWSMEASEFESWDVGEVVVT